MGDKRANLEYNITEDERISPYLGNRIKLLEETLTSHRFAISLNTSNTDIRFNAAQVMTSLAEAQLESGTQQATKHEARPLLEEAVIIFTKCLEEQQQDYAQIQADIAQAQASGEYQDAWEGARPQTSEAQDNEMDTTSTTSDGPGDWAVVEEPLTPESILETCIAQLSAITNLLSLCNPNIDLANIEKVVSDGEDTASNKIPALLRLIERSPNINTSDEPKAGPTLSISTSSSTTDQASVSTSDEALLTAATFFASKAEMSYRSALTSSTQYAQTVDRTFATLFSTASFSKSKPNLAWINLQSAFADALMDLASALADSAQCTPSAPTFAADTEIQWTALTQAQNILTGLAGAEYTAILPASRLADVFLARGDVDLFRFRISLFDSAKPAWVKSQNVLVANAGVFYRGARTYAERAGALQVKSTADAKAIVAEILKEVAAGSTVVKEHWKGKHDVVGSVLGQMVEEGIVGQENVDGVLQFTV